MQEISAFFMGVAKVAFLIGFALGCLALELQWLAKALQWLGLKMQGLSGSNLNPAVTDGTAPAASEGGESEAGGWR